MNEWRDNLDAWVQKQMSDLVEDGLLEVVGVTHEGELVFETTSKWHGYSADLN